MKRIYALLLALILCFSASMTVFAADTKLTATGAEAERNDYVYVDVALENCAAANTLDITYSWDAEVLTSVPGRSSWTTSVDMMEFDQLNKNHGVWYNPVVSSLNGNICKLAFRVNEGAKIGTTKVTCTVIVKNEANLIGTYTAEATIEVTCVHVAADDAVGTKVNDKEHSYKCAICNTDIKEDHIWDKGVETKPATETETGEKTYTCTFCGATKVEEIPVIEPEDDDFGDVEFGGEDEKDPEDDKDPDDGDKPGQGGTTPPSGDSGNQGTTTPPSEDSGNQGGTTTPETNKPETTTPETNKPETNKPSTNKPSTNKPSQPETNTPDSDDTPAVEIKDVVVKEKVDEIKKAEEGKEVVIEMKQENGKVATVVPVEILDAVKGKDVDVVLDMGEYSWTINGKDVADGAKDINLEVVLDTKVVEETVIKELAGDDTARQISLSHDGEFNFKATLTINVGKDFVGKYGNLYYHEGEGKLTFVSAAKVDENGDVALDFNHASDYVVVLGDDRTADENQEDTTTPDTEQQKPDDENNTQKPDDGDKPSGGNDGGINVGAIFTVILIIGAIAGAAYYFLKKKR